MSAQVPTPEQHRVKVEAIRRIYPNADTPTLIHLHAVLAAYDSVVAQRDEARAELAEKQDMLESGGRLVRKMGRMITQRDDALDRVRALGDDFPEWISAGSDPLINWSKVVAALSGPTGTPEAACSCRSTADFGCQCGPAAMVSGYQNAPEDIARADAWPTSPEKCDVCGLRGEDIMTACPMEIGCLAQKRIVAAGTTEEGTA